MRLMSSVLGFVLRKLGLLLALVLSLFLGYLLTQAFIPTLREAVADRDRLQQVAEERAALESELEQLRSTAAEGQSEAIASLDGKIQSEIEEGHRNVTEKKAEIERLRNDQQEMCGFMRDLIDLVTPGSACETAQVAVKKADEAMNTLEDSLTQAEEDAAVLGNPDLTNQEKLDQLGEGGDQALVQRKIDNKESELGQRKAEEESLEEAQASGVGWVVNQWARSWKGLVAIAVLVLVLPVAMRTVSYFLLMPMVSRAHKPIHLAAGSENAAADLHTTDPQRTLAIELGAGEVLSARSEHVRPVQGKVRSRLVCRNLIKRQGRQAGQQRFSQAALTVRSSPGKQFEAVDSGRVQGTEPDQSRYSGHHGSFVGQVIDQHIGIGHHHRHDSLMLFTTPLMASASSAERLPRVASAFSRNCTRSFSPIRY